MRIATVVLVAAVLAAGCAKRTVVPPPPVAPVVPGEDRREPAQLALAHTVREGETLVRIADIYYGDPSRAADLAAANGLSDPDRLAPGSVIALTFAPAEWEGAKRRAAALEPYNRGVDGMAAEDYDRAEREFRQALETAPELTDARYNLALVLMKRGRYEDAQKILVELAAQRPRDPDIGSALGNALFYQTRYADAAAAFRRVLDVNPRHQSAAFGWALSLHQGGRRDEAIAAWRAYLALDSDSRWADTARRYLEELQGGRP